MERDERARQKTVTRSCRFVAKLINTLNAKTVVVGRDWRRIHGKYIARLLRCSTEHLRCEKPILQDKLYPYRFVKNCRSSLQPSFFRCGSSRSSSIRQPKLNVSLFVYGSIINCKYLSHLETGLRRIFFSVCTQEQVGALCTALFFTLTLRQASCWF